MPTQLTGLQYHYCILLILNLLQFGTGIASQGLGVLRKQVIMIYNAGLGKDKENDRRGKRRFALQRELRFKVLDTERITTTGIGSTVDISSGGVAFETVTRLLPGTLVEVSISWPVLLEESCLMRLVVLGRVVRTRQQLVAYTVDKYEFRTQARSTQNPGRTPIDSTLRRWALPGDKEVPAKAAMNG